jgi:hypothetical protein
MPPTQPPHDARAIRPQRLGSLLPGLWLSAVIAVVFAVASTLTRPAAAAEVPATCFWDPRAIATVQQQLAARDPAAVAALADLRKDADKALTAGPFSVMDKQLVPPSGDKHDFTSVGRYYWPNPQTADGLPWVTIDGKPNPDIANGKIGDEPRLTDLWDAARQLARAAYFTHDRRYAAHAAELLRVWFIDPATRMNPNATYAARYPGHWDGRYLGIHSTARPIMDLCDVVELLKATPVWTADDQRAMAAWCGQYLTWLTTSDFGKQEAAQKNNHSVAYDCLVVRLALFTGKVDLAKQILTAAESRRIAAQIEPDGRQPLELARATPWEYSRYNLEFLARLAMLGDRFGVDLWHYRTPDGRSIRAALDYVATHATDPEVAKHVGVDRIGSLLQIAANVYHEPKYLEQMHRLGWPGTLQLKEAGVNGSLGD